MAMEGPKDPRDKLNAEQSKHSNQKADFDRADDSNSDRTLPAEGRADTSDDTELSAPDAVPRLTDFVSDDAELDLIDPTVEEQSTEDRSATSSAQVPDATIAPIEELAQEEPPSSHVSAAIESLASGAIPGAQTAAARAARDLVYRPSDASPGAIQQLPFVHGQERAAIELLFDAIGSAGPTSSAVPPMDRSFPFVAPGTGANQSADIQRLVIEVEVSLANAERISQIAISESKHEFKLLASDAVYQVKQDLRAFRESYRDAWGR